MLRRCYKCTSPATSLWADPMAGEYPFLGPIGEAYHFKV
jgi:hypothetical protein